MKVLESTLYHELGYKGVGIGYAATELLKGMNGKSVKEYELIDQLTHGGDIDTAEARAVINSYRLFDVKDGIVSLKSEG